MNKNTITFFKKDYNQTYFSFKILTVSDEPQRRNQDFSVEMKSKGYIIIGIN